MSTADTSPRIIFLKDMSSSDGNNPLKISAISTTFNCREGLKECVEQLSLELGRKNFLEIVIVDGGSTDGTWEIIKDLAEINPAIKALREPGANISRGRNVAIQNACGNVILSFDSGCRMEHDYVKQMSQPFIDDPDCQVVGAKTVATGETLFEKCVAALQWGTKKDETNPSSRAIAFRREVFDAVGGYDESVQAGEDTHFNHKWRQTGYKYRYVPQARVYWRVRSSPAALYRMQKRNAKGSTLLGNPWGLSGWAMRLYMLGFVVGAAGLLAALAGGWLVAWIASLAGFAGWLVYVLTRTMRRKRWRFFINPLKFVCAIIAMTSTDLGTWVGTIQGCLQRVRVTR